MIRMALLVVLLLASAAFGALWAAGLREKQWINEDRVRIHRFVKRGTLGVDYFTPFDDHSGRDVHIALAGLKIDSVHGVFGPRFDPSSPDESERRYAIDAYRAEADLAVALDAPMVVVHPAPQIPEGTSMVDTSQERRNAALERSIRELADIGHAAGVTFLIENLPPNFLAGGDPAQLAAVIRHFNHPRIRMCFDTGHAHISGDAPAAFEASLDVIAYLHISDNDSRRDAHQVPGEGSCPFDRLAPHMARLGPGVSAMLELFESPQSLEEHLANCLPGRLARWFATGK